MVELRFDIRPLDLQSDALPIAPWNMAGIYSYSDTYLDAMERQVLCCLGSLSAYSILDALLCLDLSAARSRSRDACYTTNPGNSKI